MTISMIIQLLIVLLALWVGSRYGSLALGAISGIVLAILVFFKWLNAYCENIPAASLSWHHCVHSSSQ